MQEQLSVTDFYTDLVLPALTERLDQAFPEFGWRRDARGWIATNDEHTHARLGVRAERVVAHGPAPRGFLVHGGEPTLWTAYVSGGSVRAARSSSRWSRTSRLEPASIPPRSTEPRRATAAPIYSRLLRALHDTSSSRARGGGA